MRIIVKVDVKGHSYLVEKLGAGTLGLLYIHSYVIHTARSD